MIGDLVKENVENDESVSNHFNETESGNKIDRQKVIYYKFTTIGVRCAMSKHYRQLKADRPRVLTKNTGLFLSPD
jgi:hypothetical protein